MRLAELDHAMLTMCHYLEQEHGIEYCVKYMTTTEEKQQYKKDELKKREITKKKKKKKKI